MNYKPEIAIIEPNTLCSLGLKSILEEIIPMATIRTFHNFNELMDDTPDMYAHYFISAQIYVEHNAFFLPRKRKTIVLASDSPQFQLSGVPVLNIYESEEKLVKNILKLHQHAHHNGYPVKDMPPMIPAEHPQVLLSAREIEVLVLITKGLINKEIADKLNISLTTVITHRKNITEKLGIKSVSGLTIYAVMNGYIEARKGNGKWVPMLYNYRNGFYVLEGIEADAIIPFYFGMALPDSGSPSLLYQKKVGYMIYYSSGDNRGSSFRLLEPDKESSKLQLQEPFVQLSDKKVVSITNRPDRIGTITVLFSDKEEGRTTSDFDWNSKEWTDYTDLSDMPYNSVVWAN